MTATSDPVMQPALTKPLAELDPELHAIIELEKDRQRSSLELIASENFTYRAVMDCLGSELTNKYSEGMPNKRYYGGNQYIDQIELLCQKRCLEAYNLNPEEWGVNVQPYSGSPANFATLNAILKPNDRLMGLDLPSGGHLTHGYQTDKLKISATSVYFQSMPYQVDTATGLMDYDTLEKTAKLFRPKLIICGGSAYPRDWDYKRFREIADQHNAYLMCDMAHISGLVSAQLLNNPFEYCDIVTTTTHKTIRGPRAGVIFYRKAKAEETDEKIKTLEHRINFSVFPACQGGPHNHQIAGIAVAMKQACTPEFKAYAKRVMDNCNAMAERLIELGYTLATGGSDNHSILWALKSQGISGSKLEKVCELAGISINKNTIAGDVSALSPSGVRIGSASLTTRGFTQNDFRKVADLLHEACQLAVDIQSKSGKPLKVFNPAAEADSRIPELKKRVQEYARSFPIPTASAHSH